MVVVFNINIIAIMVDGLSIIIFAFIKCNTGRNIWIGRTYIHMSNGYLWKNTSLMMSLVKQVLGHPHFLSLNVKYN